MYFAFAGGGSFGNEYGGAQEVAVGPPGKGIVGLRAPVNPYVSPVSRSVCAMLAGNEVALGLVQTQTGKVRGLRTLALRRLQRILLEIVGRNEEVVIVLREVAQARRAADAPVVAATFVGGVVVGVDFRALIVLAQDEVDDAADGVGAVDSGRAILQHFDAFDRRSRDSRQIDALAAGKCIGRETPSVHQYQSALAAEAAERRGSKPDQGASYAFGLVERSKGLIGADPLEQLLHRLHAAVDQSPRG